MKKGVALLVASTSSLAMAKAPSKSTFMPENKLHLQDSLSKNANIDEAKFNEIVAYVSSFYKDLAISHGATLVMENKWTDGTVNAYAQQIGTTWRVSMFGGLARRSETTPDGFALVVCHELGHHFGGFPFYGPTDWAATEGQSDYFATQVCAKRIWRDQAEQNAASRAIAPQAVRDKCDAVYSDTSEQNLCYRTALGGQSLANLLNALGNDGSTNPKPAPQFDTPDTRVVTRTNTNHPEAQCRLDTYFAGALCNTTRWEDGVIPGRNHAEGQDSVAAELVASGKSCTEAQLYTIGVRPRCWFAPQLAMALAPAAASSEEIEGNGNDAWEPGETFGVNVPLTNNLLSPVEGASLTITSSNPKVTVSGGSNAYPTIASGETAVAEAAAAVAVDSSLACGDRFSLDAKLSYNTWSTTRKLDYMLGKMATAANVATTADLSIPDNTPAGVESVASISNSQGAITRAVVTVDITHTYPGDVKINLISPSGQSFVVFNRVHNSTGAIRGSFPLDISVADGNGDWKLQVIDAARTDTGKLNSWNLELQTLRCAGTPSISLVP